MSDWWIRKVDPAAVVAESSVSSAAHSSPSAAATAAADFHTSEPEEADHDTLEHSVSHSTAAVTASPLAVPHSPVTASKDEGTVKLTQADQSREPQDERQQPHRQQQPTLADYEEDDTVVEEESERDILTLEDVIAPSTSLPAAQPIPVSPAASFYQAGTRTPSTASPLADLNLAQLSPRKAHTLSDRFSLSQSHNSVPGSSVGSALDEFINQQLHHHTVDSRQPKQQQYSTHRQPNIATSTSHYPLHGAEDNNPFAIRRDALSQRLTATATTTGRRSPAARRSFGVTLGLSIQAAIEGLQQTDDSQPVNEAGGDDSAVEDEDEEAADDDESPTSAEHESAAECSDDDISSTSIPFGGRIRRKSDPFRSSLMRMRRVSRRDSRSSKEKEETKEATVQPADSEQYERKEDSDEGEVGSVGSSSESGSAQVPLAAPADLVDGSDGIATASAFADAGDTHDGLPTFHFGESPDNRGRESDGRRGDESQPSNTSTATAATTAGATPVAEVEEKANERTKQRVTKPDRSSEGQVDEQQPGAATTKTATGERRGWSVRSRRAEAAQNGERQAGRRRTEERGEGEGRGGEEQTR